MKVLIAEDEEYNQMVVQGMIEMLYPHVEVCVVGNGSEALEKLRDEPFDLLLSDVDMPVMNGYDLLSAMKAEKIAVPAISVTAFAVSGDKEKLLMHGFDRYISKPIDMEEMKSVLDEFLAAAEQ